MLCYKDKTFCMSDCTNSECSRFVYPELQKEAENFGLGLALSDFSGRCDGYKPKEDRLANSSKIFTSGI